MEKLFGLKVYKRPDDSSETVAIEMGNVLYYDFNNYDSNNAKKEESFKQIPLADK